MILFRLQFGSDGEVVGHASKQFEQSHTFFSLTTMLQCSVNNTGERVNYGVKKSSLAFTSFLDANLTLTNWRSFLGNSKNGVENYVAGISKFSCLCKNVFEGVMEWL